MCVWSVMESQSDSVICGRCRQLHTQHTDMTPGSLIFPELIITEKEETLVSENFLPCNLCHIKIKQIWYVILILYISQFYETYKNKFQDETKISSFSVIIEVFLKSLSVLLLLFLRNQLLSSLFTTPSRTV